MNGSESEPGIVQLAVMDLLAHSGERVVVRAQYFEIYNEQIRDLLVDDVEETTTSKRHFRLRKPRMRDDVLLMTQGAHEERVSTVQDVKDLLERGQKRRSCAATELNAVSSRSHAIFRLVLETKHDKTLCRSILNLVDLAGSENSLQAGITNGMQKRETGKINQRYVFSNPWVVVLPFSHAVF